MDRGIDVDIESIGEKVSDGLREHFLHNDNNISSLNTAVYNINTSNEKDDINNMWLDHVFILIC